MLEILLALAIGLLLIVPVGAWMIMAMQQHGPTAGRFTDASQARIANTYLSRDVGSAELIRVPGSAAGALDPDDPSQGCGSYTRNAPDADHVLLQLLDDGDGTGVQMRTVYVTNTDPDGVTGVFRRTCLIRNDTSMLEDSVRILHDVETAGGGPEAECTPASDVECRDQVTFTATLAGGAPVNVRAMRRSTTDTDRGTNGNFKPILQIREIARGNVVPNFTVTLDSSESRDIDGTITSRTWTATGPGSVTIDGPNDEVATFTFASLGSYKVTLTASDGTDSSSLQRWITVDNVAPDAVASVSTNEGSVQGGPDPTTFHFDASASTDPEGDTSLRFEWNFGDGVDTLGDAGALTSATPSVQFKDGAVLGTREVTVAVSDSLGARSVQRLVIRLLDKTGQDPPPPGGIAINTDGEADTNGDGLGDLVSRASLSPRAGTVGPGREDVAVTFSTGTEPPVTWELRRGATVVESSTDASFTRTFAAGDAGEWTIALVLGESTETTRPFRLNDAPVAAFGVSGDGTAPSSRTFDSSGSSDDSEIVARQWDFGFFNHWLSSITNPTHVFTHPGSYTVTLVVTDDDGARSTAIRSVSLGGALAAPGAGRFNGNTYAWDAVPGAEEYQVHLEVTGGSGCGVSPGPVDYTVAISDAPSFPTAYPGCTVQASHRLRVLGAWGPYSPVVPR